MIVPYQPHRLRAKEKVDSLDKTEETITIFKRFVTTSTTKEVEAFKKKNPQFWHDILNLILIKQMDFSTETMVKDWDELVTIKPEFLESSKKQVSSEEPTV